MSSAHCCSLRGVPYALPQGVAVEQHRALQWSGIPTRRENPPRCTWGFRCPLPAPPNATGSCHLSTLAQIDGRVCCTGTRSTWGVPGTLRQYGRLARCSPCRCAGVPPGQPPVSEVPRFPYVGLHAALNWLLSSLLSPPTRLGTSSHCGRLLTVVA